tara:strand:- start:6357 stop:7046 length:690 start_codon:yes stop_codon:yes gene_type:complete
MTQLIKLKRSATAGAVPSAASLALGEIAVNTFDGKLYAKKNAGGSVSVVEIGQNTTAILDTFSFIVASDGQTAFTGSDSNGNTLAYNASNVEVFLNGVLLKGGGDDYTASNGTSVTLSSGAEESDELTVLAFSASIGSGDTVIDTFTGDGSTTNFSLSTNPKREENTSIFVNGVYQNKSTYSLSGTTLIFSSAPANSSAIEVEIGTRSVNTEDVTTLLPSRAEILFMAS